MAEATAETEPPSKDDDETWIVRDPERYPYSVLTGREANLAALRGTDPQTRSAFFEERNNVAAATEDECNGGNIHNNNNNNNNNKGPIRGEVFVTRTQVLFVAEDHDQSESDLAIGAACIVLHAMTDDSDLGGGDLGGDPLPDSPGDATGPAALYLQLQRSGGEDEAAAGESLPTEVTLAPLRDGSHSDDCQRLFGALCGLVSLHPSSDDEDNDAGIFGCDGGGRIGGGVGFGDDPFCDYGEGGGAGTAWSGLGAGVNGCGYGYRSSNNNSNATADGLVWGGPSGNDNNNGNNERDAMLAHLDGLLVVRPGLEIPDDGDGDGNNNGGRFDDAVE
eukprot:CAMPEP_0201252158 /NCGR_PEP_ID=MMETSP0852-20130820/66761_1 /ASSEMBLY_ACC=CAM_ASM_000632 /TAXON_ID=183588 /ORGANISM="Pseudo-nitzschia fraudulenta, Strain WWA7" /LENGTH=333 /DNA_ID=CAMNT_0047551843 /DNA_START=145 /DNA_END=1146 /DNA_ORIENTATION=-